MKLKSLLLTTLLTFAVSAQAKQYELIKEHSKIGFSIDYMLMTKVDGIFKNYVGYFDLNDAKDEIKNISITVFAKSVDTNDEKRDFHIRGHEFFLVTTYPYMTFKAAGPVKIKIGEEFQVKGTMTLKDKTKDVTFKGIYRGEKLDPWNKNNLFFNLSTDIDRKDFGIEWNKQMDNGGWLIGDDVHIDVVVQAQSTDEKTPFSTHMVPQTKGIKERDELKKGLREKLSTPTDPKDHKAPKK